MSDDLIGFLAMCAAVAAAWVGGLVGVAVQDWRDRRAGREPDRGYWP